ncbi:MAG: MlaC/ttg2D family ABC transporter substrate-binding protein [Candidatus Binatia bacterium]
MGSLRSILWTVVSIGILAFSAGTGAAEPPLEAIRSTVERARAVLEDPAYQGPDQREQRIAKVREILLPQFDSQEIAKRTLGTHWRKRTEEERKQFVQLFVDLVEKTYSSNLDRYDPGVKLFFDQERIIDGEYAEVDTRIFDPVLDKTFAINYRMHKSDGRWLIYDVIAENISMVGNYRNQFHRILSKSSYQDLVQKIEQKLKELSSASPS